MQTKTVQIIVLLAVFTVGFVLGKMNVQTPMDAAIENAKESYVEMKNTTPTDTSKTDVPTGAGSTQSTTVSADSLSDSQKKMLESFGIDTEAITITATMIACAEAKLGAARIEEIKNGATPSMLEGASLIACYK